MGGAGTPMCEEEKLVAHTRADCEVSDRRRQCVRFGVCETVIVALAEFVHPRR